MEIKGVSTNSGPSTLRPRFQVNVVDLQVPLCLLLVGSLGLLCGLCVGVMGSRRSKGRGRSRGRRRSRSSGGKEERVLHLRVETLVQRTRLDEQEEARREWREEERERRGSRAQEKREQEESRDSVVVEVSQPCPSPQTALAGQVISRKSSGSHLVLTVSPLRAD